MTQSNPPAVCLLLMKAYHRKSRSGKESLLGPKTKIRMGAWNVRTMYKTSKTAQVITEMKRYRIYILGISECRFTGTGC